MFYCQFSQNFEKFSINLYSPSFLGQITTIFWKIFLALIEKFPYKNLKN